MEGCFYRAVRENLAEEAASEQGREGQRWHAGVEGQADGMAEGEPVGRGENVEFYSERQREPRGWGLERTGRVGLEASKEPLSALC